MADDFHEAAAVRDTIRTGRTLSPRPKKKQSDRETNGKTHPRKRDRVMDTITTGGDAGEINAALADQRLADLRKKHRNLPQLVSLSEYVVRPRVAWLVRDLLPAGALAVVFGAPKSGKTQVVMDMCMHAAHGMHWHGYEITRPLTVAYLAGEGHNGLRVRLHAWQRHHATEMRGDFRLVPEALPLAARLADILAILSAYRPDVVVIDTVNAYFGSADENSTQDMTAFVAAARGIRDALNCGVILVHHTGHAEQARERGSSVMRGAVDVVIQVARDEGSGDIGVQAITARDMEAWDAPLSLRLERAPTDWADDDGAPIDSVIIVKGNGPVTLPGRGGRALSSSQQATVDAVRQLAAEHGNGGAVLLSRPNVIDRAMKLGASRAAAYRALDSLAGRMGWRFVEPGGLQVGDAVSPVSVPIGSETSETTETGGGPSQVISDRLSETK